MLVSPPVFGKGFRKDGCTHWPKIRTSFSGAFLVSLPFLPHVVRSLGSCVTTLCRIVSVRCRGALCLGSIPRLSSHPRMAAPYIVHFRNSPGHRPISLTKRFPFPQKSPPRVETYNLTGVTLHHPSLFVQGDCSSYSRV